MTPVEQDTRLLEALWQCTLAERRAQANIQSAATVFANSPLVRRLVRWQRNLGYVVDGKPVEWDWITATSAKAVEFDQVVLPLIALYGHRPFDWGAYLARDVEERAQRLEAARAEYAAAKAIVNEVGEAFEAAGGWSRYWLVTSSTGHVHANTWCHTCNKGRNLTSFALVPSLSGSTVEAAIADLGPAMCSVCFPDAPVEAREQVKHSKAETEVLASKGEQAWREARAAGEARRAKRAAKAAASA